MQPIGIAFEGTEVAQEDAVGDWLTRSLNAPLQAMLARIVQVILDWRGQHYYLAVKEDISEKDFKKEAKKRLSISAMKHIRIEPLGMDAWSVRPGFTYAVLEKRKMTMHLHDVKGQVHKLSILGDKSLLEVEHQLRSDWCLEPWIKITVAQSDKTPFWIEDKGEYTVVTQYDPSLDPRAECTVRIDLIDRKFIIDKYRAVEDYAALWKDLCGKYGFQSIDASQLRGSGNPRDGLISFNPKLAVSCLNVKIP
jgi:hypothetical protein